MSREHINQGESWYVIHTKPMQEDRVNSNLTAWGVETLLPKIKEFRQNPFSGTPVRLIKPLFPRYIFARFHADKLLHKIFYTRGVQGIVSFSGLPCKVDDHVIELLRARLGEDGLIKLGECLSPGDKVIISSGPLKNFVGIFERSVTESERISVMLTTVNFQNHIVIDREAVRKQADRTNQ